MMKLFYTNRAVLVTGLIGLILLTACDDPNKSTHAADSFLGKWQEVNQTSRYKITTTTDVALAQINIPATGDLSATSTTDTVEFTYLMANSLFGFETISIRNAEADAALTGMTYIIDYSPDYDMLSFDIWSGDNIVASYSGTTENVNWNSAQHLFSINTDVAILESTISGIPDGWHLEGQIQNQIINVPAGTPTFVEENLQVSDDFIGRTLEFLDSGQLVSVEPTGSGTNITYSKTWTQKQDSLFLNLDTPEHWQHTVRNDSLFLNMKIDFVGMELLIMEMLYGFDQGTIQQMSAYLQDIYIRLR